MSVQPDQLPVHAWRVLKDLPVVPELGGLINHTFLLGPSDFSCTPRSESRASLDSGRGVHKNPHGPGPSPQYVLQRVNSIFAPSVHLDIEAVTAHLAAKGLVTPRLVPTDTGALWHQNPDGTVWRVLTFVPGQCFHQVQGPDMAREAGRLVGRFHAAMQDFSYSYQHVRLGVHDTPAHMARLEAVCGGPLPSVLSGAHRLAEDILWRWSELQARGLPELPDQHVHGDLKISNLRFDSEGRGLCLLDLDTLGRMPLDSEMGDALRSWCNPTGEDSLDPVCDERVVEAALDGYSEVIPLDSEMRPLMWAGAERISLELAARFCRDIWEDRYFGWNANKYPSRAMHNLVRATVQYRLSASIGL